MLKWQTNFKTIRELTLEHVQLVGIVTGGHFAIHWFQQIFPVVLPSVKSGLGLSDVQVGGLTSARQLAQGSLNLPSGMLADRLVGHRALIMASALGFMGFAYLLFGAAPKYSWSLFGAALVGLGSAVWHPAAAATLSNRFPKHRATVLAAHGTGATLSDTLTPLVVGALLLAYPWQALLKIQIVPGLLLGVIVWNSLRKVLGEDATPPSRSKQLHEIGRLVKNSVFLGASACRGLTQMGRLVILTFLPIYLQEHLSYSPFLLGVHITLLHGMGILSQPLMGYLSDRFGRKAVLFPSYIAMGVLFYLLAIVRPGIMLGLVIIVIGLFFYTLMNVINAAIMDVAGAEIQASSYGLTSLVTQFVVLPTPIVAGYFVGTYGIHFAFILAGSFLIMAAVVLSPLEMYQGSKSS